MYEREREEGYARVGPMLGGGERRPWQCAYILICEQRREAPRNASVKEGFTS